MGLWAISEEDEKSTELEEIDALKSHLQDTRDRASFQTCTIMCSTTTSITFTDILDEDESRTTLRPFAVAVSFRGSLPRHTLPIVSILVSACLVFLTDSCFKPLRVSIELPEEYAGFTSPIIKTLTSHSSDKEVDMIRLAEWNDDHVSVHVPFFARAIV